MDLDSLQHSNRDGIRLAVIGDPIAQSKSPAMHNAALEALGIAGEYIPLHVKREELGRAVSRLKELGFRGWNVTIPHKVDIMPYMDELDVTASAAGAVNTVVHHNGRLTGYNTDGIGYVRSLKEEAIADLHGRVILVLGAGGAARGVVHALAAEKPAHIYIANRTLARAEELAASFPKEAGVSSVAMEHLQEVASGADVIINTTSIGMYPDISATPLPAAMLPSHIVISDLIYNPLTTKLLNIGLEKGCVIHSGLGMFVNQGAYALEYWTGKEAPRTVMREAVLQSLGK